MTNIEEKINNLTKWFEENRKLFVFNDVDRKTKDKTFETNDIYPYLKVKKIEGMGYGIVYEKEEEKGFSYNDECCILKVPRHIFLSFENIANWDINANKDGFLFWLNYEQEDVKNLKNDEVEETFLTLFLALCKKKDFNHYWKPYTDFLCELPEQGNYKYFSRGYGGVVLPIISLWYNKATKELTDYLPKPEPSNLEHPNNQIYRWAYSIIKTRASKPTSNDRATNTYLIPILDFFNTDPNGEKLFSIIYTYSGEKGSELKSVIISVKPGKTLQLRKGEQIFIDYGEDLRHYGIERVKKNDSPLQELQNWLNEIRNELSDEEKEHFDKYLEKMQESNNEKEELKKISNKFRKKLTCFTSQKWDELKEKTMKMIELEKTRKELIEVPPK